MPESSQAARARRAQALARRAALVSPTPDAYYHRSDRAAIWEGPAAPEPRSRRQVRWARKPLDLPRNARAVALAQDAQGFWVCVESAAGRRWRPVLEVLDNVRLSAWIRTGFEAPPIKTRVRPGSRG